MLRACLLVRQRELNRDEEVLAEESTRTPLLRAQEERYARESCQHRCQRIQPRTVLLVLNQQGIKTVEAERRRLQHGLASEQTERLVEGVRRVEERARLADEHQREA